MIRLDVTVEDIATVLAKGYTLIRVYSDSSETGEFTTLEGTVALVADQDAYSFVDTDGTAALWYKTAYWGSGPGESEKSEAQRGGTADAYCTPQEIRETIEKSQPASDGVLWKWAVAASEAIDRYCKYGDGAFAVDPEGDDEARIYMGTGYDKLLIPETGLLAVTEVAAITTTAGATSVVNSNYYRLWPRNARLANRPARGLWHKTATWADGVEYQVTGQFGYAYLTATPALIKQAAVVIAARLFQRGRQGFQDAAANVDLGQLFYAKQLDPEVQLWLDGFVNQPV
jgi:hypothetical protein